MATNINDIATVTPLELVEQTIAECQNDLLMYERNRAAAEKNHAVADARVTELRLSLMRLEQIAKNIMELEADEQQENDA